ncbi:MAG: chemotaxis protein CheA [Nannocystales bacterium]
MEPSDQLLAVFVTEASEHLATIEDVLVSKRHATDPEAIHELFRAAHSLKGGAGTVGFAALRRLAHTMEGLADQVRTHGAAMDEQAIDALLAGVDCIHLMLDDPEDESAWGEVAAEVSARMKSMIETMAAGGAKVGGGPVGTWRVTIVPEGPLLLLGLDPGLALKALAALGELQTQCTWEGLPSLQDLDTLDIHLRFVATVTTEKDQESVEDCVSWLSGEAEVSVERVDQPTAKQAPKTDPAPVSNAAAPTGGKKRGRGTRELRIGVEKLDALMNMVGELVITQSMLQEVGLDLSGREFNALYDCLERLASDTRGLQESVMRVRMLPASHVLSRMPRVLRDATKSLGKRAELQLVGEQTEVDMLILESLADPLLHLLRNAVAHGIEEAEVRRERNKPEVGQIRMEVAQKSGFVNVSVSDDGGGVDTERVLAKAKSLGLVTDAQASQMANLNELLFLPGLSTAAEVTDVAGRGVGMDVVAKNIKSLGGSISILSTPGEGTTVQIRLPLTLSIMDGQLIEVCGQTFVVPVLSILESQRLDRSRVRTIPGGRSLYRFRGSDVPLAEAGAILSLPQRRAPSLAVLVEAEGGPVALCVDALLGQQQIVVKSLDENFRRTPGIAAATILGNGVVAMILDVVEIGRLCQAPMETIAA